MTTEHRLEERLDRLESANRRLRWTVAVLVIPLLAFPLMSAMQDVAPSKQLETERLVIPGKDGWKLVLGTQEGERGGFGTFLVDGKGVARARLVLDGESPRIDVCSAKADHGAAIVAEDKDSSVVGVWKGKHWRLRSEIKYGRPNSLIYDGDGLMRLRHGMYKGDAYYTLVDPDGKIDRVWMMLESTGRCSVAIRPDKLAEVSMSGDADEASGVSVRDDSGRLRALMYANKDDSHVAVYGPDESTRVDLRVRKDDVGIEVVDANEKARLNLGLDESGSTRLELRDKESKSVYRAPAK